MKPGIYNVPSSEYHADLLADDFTTPTLSCSIAKKLVNESPLHAWSAHPRLNPEFAPDEDEKYDVGRIAHAVFLEGQAAVEVIDAPDWRTNAAKEARYQARVQGKTPILAKQWPEIIETVTAAREQLGKHRAEPPLFRDGKPEQTLVWEENGVVCRSRLDWLRDDYTAIDDLKTTSRSANPETWSRTIFDLGFDLQAAMYVRAVELLTGTRPEFRLAVVEVNPPYAVSVIGLSPSAMTIGEKKFRFALDLWRQCVEKDEWPGFPQEVAYAEIPPWQEARWLEKELAVA